jgi:putative ABC transport system permease protein
MTVGRQRGAHVWSAVAKPRRGADTALDVSRRARHIVLFVHTRSKAPSSVEDSLGRRTPHHLPSNSASLRDLRASAVPPRYQAPIQSRSCSTPGIPDTPPMIEIPWWRLALALTPLLVVGWISHRWVGRTSELLIATARMVVQLLVVGFVLVLLFKEENPWMAIGVVAFMILVSSWIAVRTVRQGKMKAYRNALLAVGIGGGITLALVIFGVLGLDPWYQLRYLVTLAGMIFSNAMTAVTLSAERFESERLAGKSPEEARNTAWNAALIPQVNSFLAVGLVSLPGMMTGQILAGAKPEDAVRYQIMVMAMILGSAGFAVAIFLTRTVRSDKSGQGE